MELSHKALITIRFDRKVSGMMDIHIRQESEKRIYEAARKVALILAEVNATYEEVNLILMTSKNFLTVTSSSEAPKYHLD